MRPDIEAGIAAVHEALDNTPTTLEQGQCRCRHGCHRRKAHGARHLHEGRSRSCRRGARPRQGAPWSRSTPAATSSTPSPASGSPACAPQPIATRSSTWSSPPLPPPALCRCRSTAPTPPSAVSSPTWSSPRPRPPRSPRWQQTLRARHPPHTHHQRRRHHLHPRQRQTGSQASAAVPLDLLGMLAVRALQTAIVNGAKSAKTSHGIPGAAK